MPDPIAARELVNRARHLERLLTRRRKLRTVLEELDASIRETQRFLTGLIDSDQAPAPAPGAPGAPGLEANYDRNSTPDGL